MYNGFSIGAELHAQLTAGALDVLVVGGGIVGAGIARDAAMRGLRVGLVEQHDLASGTSSRSSRLLHGGLRYLAQGRLGLVYEASREKRILHRIAPHLAEPLPFLFPAYRGNALAAVAIADRREDLRPALRRAQPGPFDVARAGRAGSSSCPDLRRRA